MGKDRTEQRVMMLNMSINFTNQEIERVKDIVKSYMTYQRVLRKTLKEHKLATSSKQRVEHKIHTNKAVINGLSQYIIDLRSEVKAMQRVHPLNNKKKDDTSKE
jgi:hypothetical protein